MQSNSSRGQIVLFEVQCGPLVWRMKIDHESFELITAPNLALTLLHIKLGILRPYLATAWARERRPAALRCLMREVAWRRDPRSMETCRYPAR